MISQNVINACKNNCDKIIPYPRENKPILNKPGIQKKGDWKRQFLRETLHVIAKTTKDYIYSQHAQYLSWLLYNVLYIETVKLIIFNVDFSEK